MKCYEGNKNDGKILLDRLKTDNLVLLDHFDDHKKYFLVTSSKASNYY